LDIKPSQGVDFCGDLYDDDFFAKMKKEKIDSVLLCNVLEHVKDIELLCDRIKDLLRPGGIIIFSGPFDYPRHFDPIDNGFRPGIDDVASLFHEFNVLSGQIVEDHTYAYYLFRDPKFLLINLLRALTPFYKFHKWKNVVIPKYLFLNRTFKVTCVIFQKNLN